MKSKIHHYLNFLKRVMRNKFALVSSAGLFIGLIAVAQDGDFIRKWYAGAYNASGITPRELRYDVHGRYTRPVKKEQLQEAKLVSDIIAGYPVNWVFNYASVEILTTSNGKARKALSINDHLSTAQKSILNTADPGTDVVIDIMYLYKNPVTNIAEDNGMHVVMTVIPDVEAEYAGGYPQMIKYLKENMTNKFSEKMLKAFQQGMVYFTVNEKGEITNAKIADSSGDAGTDRLLLDVINKMPKWKPAENSKGIKVKQEFEFSINTGMDGC